MRETKTKYREEFGGIQALFLFLRQQEAGK